MGFVMFFPLSIMNSWRVGACFIHSTRYRVVISMLLDKLTGFCFFFNFKEKHTILKKIGQIWLYIE